MEGLGVAASIIAVVDASVKVITLCSQYSTAVVNARADILRLEMQVKGLKTTLDHAGPLIETSNSPSLSASRDLIDHLQGCRAILQELQAKLELGATRKVMRRVGLRSLKWPFGREEMEAKIAILERHQRRIMDGLQIDQTTLLLHITNRVENLSTNEDTTIARKPHFAVPFPRDPDFVKRPAIQTWIQQQDTGTTSRVALVGLGGFGKTQIAIEFAHEVHCSSPGRSVFWVYGSTKATFEESYRSLADKLALPRRHDPKINILALVRDWLQREDVTPWLMILDNADNLNVFFSKTEAPIASYLPKTSNGNILITSRNLNVAEKLTGSHKAIQQIHTMGSAEALQLFENKLVLGFDEQAAADLVRILDFVPLAVNQAAAYINRRRISIHSYMERFQDNDKQKNSLLNHDGGDIRRHESVSNSVVVTWQVTFEQLRQEQPAAANLLSLMSFFHAHNIPQYMLSGYGEVDMHSKERDIESEVLEDDMDVLLAYSLVNTSAIAGFCEMHYLVQYCTQKWLLNSDDLTRWKRHFLQLISKHFPSGAFETWAICQILSPHIEMVLVEQPPDEADMPEWSLLLTNVSWYRVMTGDSLEAEVLAQKAVEVRKRLLGADHPSTLMSMGTLASTYRNQGRWEEAEKLEVYVMETRKTKLGADHPDTLTSMGNLASTYSKQGRWEEAEKLEVQVVETRKNKLGADHPDTLTSMGNLASTYSNQGRWEEAEKLEVQVMETSKAKLGADHPDAVTSMGNLASTYRKQGRWGEAEKLEVHVMETRKTKLGADHPATLTSMANLAFTFWKQGRWEEAEKLEVHVMETRNTKLGADHPDAVASMGNLASTYRNQGRWEDAEKLEVQVMETSKAKLGAEHPDTLTSMANVAFTFWKQGRWEEAEKLEVQVMETRKSKLGADHPDTLTSMGNLASTYRDQGRWDEAEKLEMQAVETLKAKLGADHPDTLTSMGNLASTYRKQGRWDEAEKLEMQVMETSKAKLGAEHPDTLTSMANVAFTFWKQGRWEEAEKLQMHVMETRNTKLGADHPDAVASMGNLASTYRNQGRLEEAKKLDMQVMETFKTKLGADHPSTLTSMGNLAFTFWSQGRWEEAEKLEVYVMETRKTKLGADHPDTLTSMGNLASTYSNQGRWEEAEKLGVQVMETSKTKLGANHPDTLKSMNNLAFTFRRLGRLDEAIEVMHACVSLRRRILGPEHPDTKFSVEAIELWEQDVC